MAAYAFGFTVPAGYRAYSWTNASFDELYLKLTQKGLHPRSFLRRDAVVETKESASEREVVVYGTGFEICFVPITEESGSKVVRCGVVVDERSVNPQSIADIVEAFSIRKIPQINAVQVQAGALPSGY